jgi:uncharacterized protein (DUF305 family)
MKNPFARVMLTGLLAAALGAAAGAQSNPGTQTPPEPKARPDLVRFPYTDGDVEFMSGMIPHHAQAVLIAGWAKTHGASQQVQMLCERQVISQRDEIEMMRNWLRDRSLEVPPRDATKHKMKMGDMVHEMLMPGMLTDEELARLDKARGRDWDRLFLESMIKHHEGALKMVDDLFKAPGAMLDEDVFKFASDVFADQTAEIERMQKMLAAMKESL